MITSENIKIREIHGCLVCDKLFNILAVYTLDGLLADSTVTDRGGDIVPDTRRPLVACDTHTVGEIESAYTRWQSTKVKDPGHEQEEE